MLGLSGVFAIILQNYRYPTNHSTSIQEVIHEETPQNVYAMLLADVYSVGSLNNNLKESPNTSDVSRKGGVL